MYLNKSFVLGNLTRDPELRALPSGIKVCSMSLATNRVWKDKTGAKQESADYHNIIVFGNAAETAAQYLRKGQSCLIEGRIQTRSWDDKDGQKKYRTEIVADRVQFGPKANRSDESEPKKVIDANTNTEVPPASKSSPARSKAASVPMDTIEYPDDEINPDDIPF